MKTIILKDMASNRFLVNFLMAFSGVTLALIVSIT